jgi:hypothetical protein
LTKSVPKGNFRNLLPRDFVACLRRQPYSETTAGQLAEEVTLLWRSNDSGAVHSVIVEICNRMAGPLIKRVMGGQNNGRGVQRVSGFTPFWLPQSARKDSF